MTPTTSSPSGERAGRRRNNPRGQGERLREELIEAASTLVAEAGGASQLSIRAVAARVGVAATSVYLHFADLDELKIAVAERCFAELAAARDAALADINDPAASLVARCQAYVRFAIAHPGYYRLMFGPDLPPPVFTQAYDAVGSASRSAYGALIEAIHRCQQTGAARDDTDPRLLGALLWPALHGQVSLRIDRPDFPRPPLEQVIAQTVERLVGLNANAHTGHHQHR
jgi:AcrR family transcriptional regulator